ncbi:unannotated protein [freshwater metagenome]|uniref:Unannotated protein n=1 Tax=freshwater metagenome TaxID=449393 RepID=A0A6J6ZJ77_9ZZZZ
MVCPVSAVNPASGRCRFRERLQFMSPGTFRALKRDVEGMTDGQNAWHLFSISFTLESIENWKRTT